jgi:fibronectin-binding autotransporter adhesin
LGTIGANALTVKAGGSITGMDVINVGTGTLNLTADDGGDVIEINNPANRFGRLLVSGTIVSVANSGATVLGKIDVENLNLISKGNVTDGAEGLIQVTGAATISTEGNITLGASGSNEVDAVQIGSVSLTGKAVSLIQTGDITVAGIDATSLTMSSKEGGIFAANGTPSINVTGLTSFAVPLANGIINLLDSNSKLGDLTLSGASVSVRETDTMTLQDVTAKTLVLQSTVDILNSEDGAMAVSGAATLTAGRDITLGGATNAVRFGSIGLNAASASIIEADSAQWANIQVTGDLHYTAPESITDIGTVINVGGRATITVTGAPQLLRLDGISNRFASLKISSDTVDLNLAEGTVLASVRATTLDASVQSGTLTIGESGQTYSVRGQSTLFADNIVVAAGSTNLIGGLKLTTTAAPTGSVDVRSSLIAATDNGNPTLASGVIDIRSPTVLIGVDGGEVDFRMPGAGNGGAVTISGVDATGNRVPAAGVISLIGTVWIDTTSRGDHPGANIVLVSDTSADIGGVIRARDSASPTSLRLTAGSGLVDLGNLVELAQVDSLNITGADVNLDDVYIAGNTIDVVASGSVHVSGEIRDALGNINIAAQNQIVLDKTLTATLGDVSLLSATSSIQTHDLFAGGKLTVAGVGNIALNGNTSAEGGIASLTSTTGSVTTVGDLAGTAGINVSANKAVLLGGNATASAGTVTLKSLTETVDSRATIGALGDVSVAAAKGITLGTVGGSPALSASDGKVTIVTGTGDILLQSDLSSAHQFTAVTGTGAITQTKNTSIVTTAADGSVTLSSKTGIAIASIHAASDVTLVITQESFTGTSRPTFSRVNDPIPFGQGDAKQDIFSARNITFIAPVANVGSQTASQNFVQRGSGIFYGLESGKFFSDDIGRTQILAQIPTTSADSLRNLFVVGGDVLNLGSTINGDIFNVDTQSLFSIGIKGATIALASAGETGASSSSRATAASQRDEDEEVAEVDEAAFQDLRNYDENPQGILLPEDQRFAYDKDGNIYFMVTLKGADGHYYRAPLYKVQLGLTYGPTPRLHSDEDEDDGDDFTPTFVTLAHAGGGGAEE